MRLPRIPVEAETQVACHGNKETLLTNGKRSVRAFKYETTHL